MYLVGTQLFCIFVQTLLSGHEPVPSHSRIRIEFADDQLVVREQHFEERWPGVHRGQTVRQQESCSSVQTVQIVVKGHKE